MKRSGADFTLRSTTNHFVSLSELRGGPVILAYPADWALVCGDLDYMRYGVRVHQYFFVSKC